MIEIVIAIELIIFFIFTTYFLNVNIVWSFYFTAALINGTILAGIYINVLVGFLSLIFVLLYKKINFSDFIKFNFLMLLFFVIASLSLANNGDILHIIGRLIKLSILFFPFFFIKYINPKYIKKLIEATFYLSIPFYIINTFFKNIIYGWGGLIPRYDGFFNDPNYFGFLAISFYVWYDLNTKKKSFTRKVMVLSIFMTQSFTAISLFIAYFLFKNRKFINRYITNLIYKNITIFPILVLSLLISFLFYLHSIDVHLIQSHNGHWTPEELKINSGLIRVLAQVEGLRLMIEDPDTFVLGYGSGHTVKLFGHAFHNMYIQAFFDNGIIFAIILIIALFYLLKKIKLPMYLFFLIIFHNIMFDDVMNLIICPVIFIFMGRKQTYRYLPNNLRKIPVRRI